MMANILINNDTSFLFIADCEAPEEAVHPLLVTYNGTVTGSVAVYTCTDGYALTGNDTTSYCDEDGEWTDIDAECIGKKLIIIIIIIIIIK